MAEKTKDQEDRLLEAMFADSAIADDGFSKSVVRRIRRQIWIRRLALPVAILIGGAVAIGPLTELASVGTQLSSTASEIMPTSSFDVPENILSRLPWIMGVAGFGIIGLLSVRVLEH